MKKSILIIDDDSTTRSLLEITLKGSGFEVTEAENGSKGLDRLDGKVYHLIICDVNMPVMDGITFVKTLQSSPAYSNYRHVPVILLTVETDAEFKMKGKDAGAKAWITKPFMPDILLNAVNKLILP